jgi:hypothetical protein
MTTRHPRISTGDTVTLNDHGLEVCFGQRGMSHMKTKRMHVTHVDKHSITEPEQTFIVEVDDPEINNLMIYDACFDKVPT